MVGFRNKYKMCAEVLDMFRVIPRLLVGGYVFLLYKVVDWYMNLEPYFPEDVVPMLGKLAKNSADISLLMVQAPTTQHTALVTAVVGIAAAVFGLYTSTGHKWDYKSEADRDSSND